MKLKREAKTLKTKALCSLRHGVAAFNGFEEEGRITTVLLHLQHASEMLVKALLVQKRVGVHDDKTGHAHGMERCLNLAHARAGLTEAEAGVMRTVDSLRDAAQHWIVFVDEAMLYLHARALVTIFDDVLKRSFEDDLASHLPARVLPISTAPPVDVDLLVDREFTQVAKLLAPGRRARDEARGRIRSLLAMESHAVDNVQVSERDIDRVEKAIRQGKTVGEVFPRLATLATSTEGEGISVRVHFTKKQGPPVRFVGGDDPEAAAAVREVDLQNRFRMQATELANVVGLSAPRCGALRAHHKIDKDPQCMHVFEFKKTKITTYSETAARRMKEALETVDIEAVWAEHRPLTRRKKGS